LTLTWVIRPGRRTPKPGPTWGFSVRERDAAAGLVRFAAMRQLLPAGVEDADPAALYAGDDRTAPPGRPWVAVNMIATLDGATSIGGVSGGLGAPADKAVFAALRAVADVILVAAGTVRAERYGPVHLADDQREARVGRGQAAVPRLAIVTARLDLALDEPLFTESVPPPIVLTVADAPADRRAATQRVAEVVSFGHGAVDLAAALAWLAEEHAARIVLCEGGPSLNGALIDADLVDEWCQTISPHLLSGPSARAAHSATASPRRLEVTRVLEGDGLLFVRSVRAAPG